MMVLFIWIKHYPHARRMRIDRAAVEHIAGRKGAYARRA